MTKKTVFWLLIMVLWFGLVGQEFVIYLPDEIRGKEPTYEVFPLTNNFIAFEEGQVITGPNPWPWPSVHGPCSAKWIPALDKSVYLCNIQNRFFPTQ